MGIAIFGTVTRAVGAAVGEIGKAVSAASDLNESLNKVGVAFGDSSQDILKWSENSATALGQSRQQALEAVSSFGLLFRTMGVGSEESAAMSKAMVQLATDMASINNIPIDDALVKLRAGLVGEAEPLRTVGVLINAAAVEAKAMALGLAGSTDALTEQDKVMARYQLILDQTALTQGDFARTLGGVANQQRILNANIENGRALLGQAFLPIWAEVLRGANLVIQQMSGHGEGIVQALATGLVNGVIYLLPVVRFIRDFFTEWFRPSSPPKILPDLARWGAETIGVWLRGMADADFGILRNLGGSIEGILRSFVGTGAIQESDLISRIFGSQAAIVRAIQEWKRLGTVSARTLDDIRRAAGPAGNSIAGLVRQYLAVQSASEGVARAQQRLNDITAKYQRILSPIRGELGANQSQQQALRDRMRIAQLQEEIADTETTADERRLAQLEIEAIQLQKREAAIERKQGKEEDAAQAQLDAAKTAEDAAQAELARQEAIVDQQVRTNALIAEEIRMRQQALDEAKRAAEEAQRNAEAQAAALERVREAQLAYNLAVASSEERIRLLKEELGRYAVGSVEYYQTLGQIHGAEEQLRGEQEAAARSREAEQEAAAREAEQAADEAKRLAEQRNADLERLYQATLRYNLATTDTEGQLALMRLELGRYKEGSAEYYGILTQIAQLEQQLAREREAAAKGGGGGPIIDKDKILPSIEELEIPEWVKELQTKLHDAVNEAFGIGFTDPLSLSDILREKEGSIVGEVSQSVKDFVKTIDSLVEGIGKIGTEIGKAVPSLEDIAEVLGALAIAMGVTAEETEEYVLLSDEQWGRYAKSVDTKTKEAATKSTNNVAQWIRALTASREGDWIPLWELFRDNALEYIDSLDTQSGAKWEGFNRTLEATINITQGHMDGGWAGAWAAYVAHQKEAADQVVKNSRERLQWLMNLFPGSGGGSPADSSSPLTGLQAAGIAIINMLSGGVLKGFADFQLAWMIFFGWVRDTLPGSEPADSSSPLYGLKDAGRAIVDNIWEGFEKRWQQFTDWWKPKLQAFRDLLPFSEPKDSSSPLRGLDKAGAGIIGQIQRGMERAALTISPTIAANLAGAGTSTVTTNNTNSNSWGPINLHFHGPITEAQARDAANKLQMELRQRGAPV